ncbi:hypothetical protein D3C75_1357050 [compost metagenome]
MPQLLLNRVVAEVEQRVLGQESGCNAFGQRYFAALGLKQPVQNMQQGGFPRTVPAHNRKQLSPVQR